MDQTVVDRLFMEFRALADLLERDAEPSLRSTADDCFRKALLLTAASHFESSVTAGILAFVNQASSGNERVIEFARQKGISRQYHTLFDWERSNANKFFSLFGESFKRAMEQKAKAELDFEEAVKAFLEVGRERNRLVHQDFGNFPLEKTADEIYALYLRAKGFADVIPTLLSLTEASGPDSGSA